MQFRQPVYACGGTLLVFAARDIVRFLAEDVVRRDVDQGCTFVACRLREVAYGGGVEEFRELGVVLRLVNVGVCRAVHYRINVVVIHRFFHCIRIGDVETGDMGAVNDDIRDVCENIIIFRAFRGKAQAIAELSVGSGHEYVHCCCEFFRTGRNETRCLP